MATFVFLAESFGSDPGSTDHVGLSGGGKPLSWRDSISASLFNMEIRPRPVDYLLPLHFLPNKFLFIIELGGATFQRGCALEAYTAKIWRKTPACGAIRANIQAPSFCAVKWRRLV